MAASVDIHIDGFSDSITVRKLAGTEEMSRCYYYDVTVEISASSVKDFNSIAKAAKLTFSDESGKELTINSKVAESVQITDPSLPSDKARFKLHLVPEIWFMGLSEKTKIYIDKPFNDIISEQFDTYGVKYQISDLDGTLFGARPLVSQYKESSLNFVSRLLEGKGVYYYFNHDDADSLVISNSQQSYGNHVEIDQFSEIEPGTWTRYTRVAPTKVRLTGYDFRKPSYDIFGEADTGDAMVYEIHVDDEPVRDQDEAMQLAQIRLEQLRVYLDYVTFRSFNYYLIPGAQFKKDGNDYVVIQVNHSYVHEDAQKTGDTNHYRNSVLAIRSDVIFRPELTSKIPYADGSEIAHVFSETDSDVAMIDEEGHYTVKLNYVSDKKNEAQLGKLRMQQPASGEQDGIYFPLKNGTEVIIAFNKGNPDLPYIHGTMSNGMYPSHVKGGRDQNPHHSIIKARHMLAFQALGGSHSSLTAEKFAIENNHKFEKLTTDGASEGDMDDLEEMSGNYHVERRYGHKYSYIDGCDYYWTKEGTGTFNFGYKYVENHDSVKNVSDNTFDMNSLMTGFNSEWAERKAGFVEKTWGDKAVYHKGRIMSWGGGEGPGESHQSYNYGPRYTENLVEDDQGTSADKGGMHDEGASRVSELALTEKTFGDTYRYQSGNSATIIEGDSDFEQHGNTKELQEGDAEFKRTGKHKATHDGEVESEYMDKVTTTTQGNIQETMNGDVETSIMGKVKVTMKGGRETKEMSETKHEFMAPLTLKHVSVTEETSGTKKETIKGPHTIEYSSTVTEKGAQMKSQEAKMLEMKGSMASMKIDLIMLG